MLKNNPLVPLIERLNRHLILSTKSLLTIGFILFLLCFVLLMVKYSDSLYVPLQNDEIEYHVLGANLSSGYGYKLLPPNFDHIQMDIYSTKEYATEIKDAPYNFFRTPVYPLTIAAAYALFGIDPRYVKILQIGLVALCAAAIPLIASYYWGTSGFISGLISCSLFVFRDGLQPDRILSETLIVFGLVLWSVLFTLLEFRSSNNIDFFLGLLTGALILIKGSMLFLGIITPFYFLVRREDLKEWLIQSRIFA